MDEYKNLRIVFMGTPEFAVASLQILVDEGCTIVGVITAPDKPAGRGLQLQESAVKQYAKAKGLTILQPEKLKNENFIQELKSLNGDLQVVVAFRMLPEVVWNMPKYGTINVHGSLLPDYRGAAPINWAIINGEKETGVTIFKLKHEIDTGDILLQEKIEIGKDETAGDLLDKMKAIGAKVLVATVKGLAENAVIETPQKLIEVEKKAPKIFTETCLINWNKSVDEVYNLIRGLSPYPAAFTILQDKKLKIFSCKKTKIEINEEVGSFKTDNKTYLKFVCNDGFIEINELQLEGKRKMNVVDFLKGFRPH